VLKENSCALKNEIPFPNFKSSEHSPSVSYTVEAYK